MLEIAQVGRPRSQEKTVQISLRLPESWLRLLRQRAVELSVKENRTVTPQEVARILLDRALAAMDE